VDETYVKVNGVWRYVYRAVDQHGQVIVGDRVVVGRDAVRAVCDESAGWLATVSTTFTKFDPLVGDGFVVADTTAEYVSGSGDRSVVASCDVYRFVGDRLTGITSYTVEIGDRPAA
jgi:hypothetical protein